MEMDDLHTTKRSRLGSAANGGGGGGWAYEPPASAVKIGDDKDNRGSGDVKNGEDGGRKRGGVRLHANWHQHASRICRVSRASGGKDRHSKVLTAKGLRDRRVRLSVSTAIQFYDLQDRLGVDQPSKAVEWLIKAASAAINELPALDGPFLEHPDQLMIEEKPGTQREENDAAKEEDGDDGERNDYIDQQQQHLSLSKSACSSTSETSKGSVLSLSRSERRVKARGRVKERDSAKEKEKKERDGDDVHHPHDQDMHHHNHNSQSSFTELLTGGGGGRGGHDHGSVTLAQAHTGDSASSEAGFFPKQIRHLPVAAAATDYFSQAGLFVQGHKPHQPPGFPAQTHFGNSSSIGMMPFNAASSVATAGEHPEMQQQFSFLQDHVIPVAAIAASGEYSLNFSIASGLAGFNRGTLQSNSPSTMPHYHHLQRFPSPVDGSNLPSFLTTPAPAAPASGENHFPTGYDSRLQLCYGDGYRNTDLKGKGKG